MNNKNNAKKYLRIFLKVAPLSHALWRSAEALSFEQIHFRPPVLDLGCGFGEFAGVVFDQIEMGIDINQKELSQALKGKKYKKVKWADARKLPAKNNSYSTVVSVSVLEHIEEAEKVIFEANRVLKKDGIFAFSVVTTKLNDNLLIPKICNFLGLGPLGEKYVKLHSLAFRHSNLRPAGWWAKQLKKANFEIIRQEGTFSPTLLKLHELFLITAFPSQFWKLFFGKRLIMSSGIRSRILPLFFSKFVYIDKESDINIFFVARKIT